MNNTLTLIDKESRTIGKWTIVKEKHIDDCPDLSWIGEYSSRWEEGAIDRFKSPRAYVENPKREFRYFIPCTSVESHREGLISLGCSKGEADRLARSYVMQSFEEMEGYGRKWGMYGFVLKIFFEGVEIVSDSLWGIQESWTGDFDNSFHAEIWRELWYAAKSDARETLDKVCESWKCAA